MAGFSGEGASVSANWAKRGRAAASSASWRIACISLPKLLTGQARAFGQRLEFGPDDGGVDLGVIGGLRGEAAIRAGGGCKTFCVNAVLRQNGEQDGDAESDKKRVAEWAAGPVAQGLQEAGRYPG